MSRWQDDRASGRDPADGVDTGEATAREAAAGEPGETWMERFSATWLPGSTDLTGTCFCGARHRNPDPVAMWDWLDAHPDGHDRLSGGRFKETADRKDDDMTGIYGGHHG